MKNIYLDYAATTPVDKKVLSAMLPFFQEAFGNASSLHRLGRDAREAVEQSRSQIAQSLGVQNNEVIFTGGATESNNLAVKGVFQYLAERSDFKDKKLHFITSSLEHHCVLDSFGYLEKSHQDRAEVDYLKVNQDGLIDLGDLRKKIKENTVLVSIMYVNNEVGVVQPISEIGQVIEEKKRSRKSGDLPLYFHTDAVQAFNCYDCALPLLKTDMLTLSGHKIYGPKGVGVLAVKSGVRLTPILHGGGHEFGKRSGTLNVPGIVGLGAAIKLAQKERRKDFTKIKELRDYFINRIEKEIKDVRLNGSRSQRSPNNANFSFKGVEGESMVLMLDKEGIAVSTGSACSSETLAPSHVQMALGASHLQAHSSIRFTFGKYLTKKDIDYSVEKIKQVTGRLREISREIEV